MWVRVMIDSGTEFRELSQSGIRRNRKEFLKFRSIPEFPEFRHGTELELIPGIGGIGGN
jgi:hypothetical protein